MTQITKKKKKKRMAGQFWKKRLFSETFFTSFLIIARELLIAKGENSGKMCQLFFLKI